MSESARTVAVLVGTRPEAVKVAPVITALRAGDVPVALIDTGQQAGRVAEAVAPFGLKPDRVLSLRRVDGGLNELIAGVISAIDDWLREWVPLPGAILVQGDTSTAFAAATAAVMRGVPVVHLEAGLRTGDRTRPFPEEINRTLIANLAELHLAPTSRAARALAEEGHTGPRVVITGNTIVDALEVVLPHARARPLPVGVSVPPGLPLLVVTVHRREAWGRGVQSVCDAVRDVLDRHRDLRAVVVTHPNPAVAAHVHEVLDSVGRCELIPPLPYDDMLALLSRATVALTDSGGIQEEAPSLRVQVVVARELTERPEGVRAGWADLVGLDRDLIAVAVSARLSRPFVPPTAGNPYGDGLAAKRCAQAIRWMLGDGERPANWQRFDESGLAY